MTRLQQSPHSIAHDIPTPRLPVSDDDTGDGLLIFLAFIIAALTSTMAVVVIALADEWWVVGFGFAAHVIVTAIVVQTIVQTLGGSHHSIAHRKAITDASVSPPSARAGSERERAATTTASPARLPAAALEPRTHQLAAQGDRRSPQPAIASERRDYPSSGERPSGGAGTPRVPSRRERPPFQASPLERDRNRRTARRVLVVTDETLASVNEVPQPILEHIEAGDEVYVVAPTLTTWLQSLTGDINGARASADERLRTVFDHMAASGLEPHGTVGDEDQIAAIADALDDFSADLILLRLHALGSQNENWREHRLVEWARTRSTVPTIVFHFDDEGHVVGPADATAPVTDAA